MSLRKGGCLLVLAAHLAGPLTASTPDDWELLKSLVGEWEGTYDGQPARVSYRLVSNGTVLLETLDSAHDTQMVTLYHRDGSSILLTHYCSMNNQSRMRSPGLREGRLEFAWVDGTNLGSPEDHHMTRLVLSLPDRNHLVQEWTSKAGAQENVGRFLFQRAGQ